MVGIETKYRKVYASGKRKSAVAKAIIKNGEGTITFNQKPISTLSLFDRLSLEEPFRIAKDIFGKADFDCQITVKGGGSQGQIDAARLAFAKALVEYSQSDELKQAFLDYDRNLLVADARRKETRKPGDSKARAKRQTSYR